MEELQDLSVLLSSLYQDLLTKSITPVNVGKIIYDEVRPKMLFYIDMAAIGTYEFTDYDKQNIYMTINILQYIYNYSGDETGLTDTQYNDLYELMIYLTGEDVITVDLPSDVGVDYHTYKSLRGTLSKVYYLSDDEARTNPSRKYLSEWVNMVTTKLHEQGMNINIWELEVYIFPKWDGCSVIKEYAPDGTLIKALTRGYTVTNRAQNITHCFPNDIGKKTPNGYGLKTEILMRNADLEWYNNHYGTKYKQTRSIVSAILNSNESDERVELLVSQELRTSTIIDGEETLQELAEGAFDAPFLRCRLKDTEYINDFANSHEFVDGLRCDGAVIYIIDEDIRKALGREDDKNLYEVAYKFTEEVGFSEIKDVVFNVGMSGRITPVAKIKPITLKGNTISSVSLGSIGRFNKLNLTKGDTIKILYCITPYLIFDGECTHNGKKLFDAPNVCPDCFMPLTPSTTGDSLSCTNPDCNWRKKGKIHNYLKNMDIPNIRYNTISVLYDTDILKSIKDVYKLKSKKDEIISIDGFGEKSYDNMIASIESKIRVPDYKILGSIGIDGVGDKKFKAILDMFTLDELLDICTTNPIQTLICVKGIQEKTAKKVADGIKDNKKLINFLIEILDVYHMNTGPVRFTVCFTKIRDKRLNEIVYELGGDVVETLNKNVNYLVVPNELTTGSKVTKAQEYGIEVVPINKFERLIRQQYRN